MVITSDVPPREIIGSGMPVTGSRPMTYPMLIAACPTSQMVAADATILMNGSTLRLAMRRPVYASRPNRSRTRPAPMSPNSSPMMAKMKSESAFGNHPVLEIDCPRPAPKIPPCPRP